MGYSHAGSQTLTRAYGLLVRQGFPSIGSTWSPSIKLLCNRGGLFLKVCRSGPFSVYNAAAASLGSNSMSWRTSAQAIRAVLFASATVDTLACFRARSPLIQ